MNTEQAVSDIQKMLFEQKDEKYRDFHCRLMPTVAKESVIGVRIPVLRRLSSELFLDERAGLFIAALPHTYYEENNLHAFLLERIKDFSECVSAVDAFLPYVDNWATCDSMRPAAFKKNTDELLAHIWRWLGSKHTYTVRFAVEMLMSLYLEKHYKDEYPEYVAAIKSDDYYVNMMRAWYFATALAKQRDSVLPYLTGFKLDEWTHNKTIRKSLESYRISDEDKRLLRGLKIG